MKTTKALFSITILIVAMACWTFGQTTEFTYQGKLNDSSVPASGNYDFEFLLFSSASGGTQIGSTNARNSVAVAGGIFSVTLDFGTGFPGADRYLEIRVRPTGGSGITILAPRQKVNSTPYGIRSQSSGTADSATTATTATNFTGNLLGDVTGTQAATVVNAVGGQSSAAVATAAQLAVAATSANTANTLVRRDAGGGFAAGTISATGATLTGPVNMSNNIISNIGNAGTDFTATGGLNLAGGLTVTGAVSLPADAVSAAETFDEAGVASATSNTAVGLDGGVESLLTRTITAPSTGFILVIATLQCTLVHTSGTTSTAIFGISDNSVSLPGNQDLTLMIPGSAPTGNYSVPVTVHGLFTAAPASPRTFWLLGDEVVGSASVSDIQLTLLYVPTSYGTVTPTLARSQKTATDVKHLPIADGRPLATVTRNAPTAETLKNEIDELRQMLCSLKPDAQACNKSNK